MYGWYAVTCVSCLNARLLLAAFKGIDEAKLAKVRGVRDQIDEFIRA